MEGKGVVLLTVVGSSKARKTQLTKIVSRMKASNFGFLLSSRRKSCMAIYKKRG